MTAPSTHNDPRKTLSDVVIHHTNNPQDRDIVIGRNRRLALSPHGIEILDDKQALKVCPWNEVIRAIPYPLDQHAFCEEAQLPIPKCPSCGAYRDQDCCDTCACLCITDTMGIFEEFEYALEFSDPYYREAFVKWVLDRIG